MRAGFVPQRLAATPDDILNRTYLHPRFDELLISEFPLVAEPGSIYEYSQGVSDIVAIVLERATGRRYAEFISREVMQPLGARGGEVWVGRPGGMAHSGCCLQTPADTWLRLGILLLDDGIWRGKRLLPRGYVAEMRKPTLQNPYYGMGVFTHEPYIERRGFASPRAINVPGILHSEPYAAKDLFLFDGNGSQVVYMVPSQRLVIVRTGNARPKKPGLSEWDNTFIPNTVLRAIGR
jgi:CubicO group peptidase (beta-lactamase class C family)